MQSSSEKQECSEGQEGGRDELCHHLCPQGCVVDGDGGDEYLCLRQTSAAQVHLTTLWVSVALPKAQQS